MTIRGKAYSFPEYQNRFPEVAQLAKVVETSEKGISEIIDGRIKATIRSEVNSFPELRNRFIMAIQLAKVLETRGEGIGKVVQTGAFVRMAIRDEVDSFESVLEVARIAEPHETSEEGAAKVVQMTLFVGMTGGVRSTASWCLRIACLRSLSLPGRAERVKKSELPWLCMVKRAAG